VRPDPGARLAEALFADRDVSGEESAGDDPAAAIARALATDPAFFAAAVPATVVPPEPMVDLRAPLDQVAF
jgi:hypothetical protein